MSKTLRERLEHVEAAIAGIGERIEAAIAGIGHNGGPAFAEPPPEQDSKPTLIPDRRVAERYNVSTRTLARWDETPGLNFPPVIYILGRRYRELAKLDVWDRGNARKAATQTKPRGHSGRFAKRGVTP